MIFSSFVLKIIAVISMTCDHLGYVIYHDVSWLNYIGRLSLPIFAWQITIGTDKTKDEDKYLLRLLILALISQPIFTLYLYLIRDNILFQFNILFSLALGVLSICILKENKKIGIIIFLLNAVLAQVLNIDYGSYGILMIMIFYLFRNNEPLMVALQILNLVIYEISIQIQTQAYSIISIFLILLYNGKKGKEMKGLFYSFYPLHLLILDMFIIIFK